MEDRGASERQTNRSVCQNSCWLVGDQILISFNKMEVHYLKIIQCDFPDFFRFCLSQLRCTYDENYSSLHSL